MSTAPITPGDSGVLLIDKPEDMTSFRMVQIVRRVLGIKKVGHAGTLDPFATGLLLICVGRAATRLVPQLMEGEKEYEATLRLGIETDTLDREGRVVAEYPVGMLDDAYIHKILHRFTGPQMQAPPAYSAAKHQGQPLYAYARKGIVIEKPPRSVMVRSLLCTGRDDLHIHIRVVCSKGTYIRSLAADIGSALGCGAHLVQLRRLASGAFSVSEAVAGQKISCDAGKMLSEALLPVEMVLARIAATKEKGAPSGEGISRYVLAEP